MINYGTSTIRNVCLLGHGSTGKTTLAEAMLYNTGVLDRIGKIVDGTTTTDYDPEEIKRKFSINVAMAPFEWNNSKVNLFDTPGYFDFVGEVYGAIRVADSALIVVSGKDGVQVGTEKSWEIVEGHKLPRFIFINKMDEDNVSFDTVISQISELIGNSYVVLQYPIFEGGKFFGFIDILTNTAFKIDNGKLVETEIPSSLSGVLEELDERLNESVAETSEEMMEKYFSGELFTREEKIAGLCQSVRDCSITPILLGSAYNNILIKDLMNYIVQLLPTPLDMGEFEARSVKDGEVKALEYKEDGPLAAFVFKTIADPFVGRISLLKVYSGILKSDSIIYNSTLDVDEKIGQLFLLRGKKQIPVNELKPGDVGAVAKLNHTKTNNTLCDRRNPILLEEIEFPIPTLHLAVEPQSKGDEEKINSGLSKIQDEDSTFNVSLNSETNQIIISGLGEQHLDIVCSKLKSKYGVSVNLSEPKIPYRETIKKKVKVEGKHKKQSGGHGQYGHVWIEFEPGETEELTFGEKIFGGAVPKNYFPAVEKGLIEACQKGVLAGYPVVFLKATLVDGSYHPVDSSELAFKIAASLAFKKGLQEANPVILEPIYRLEIYVPERNMGDIIGDLNKRRGRILGMNHQDNGYEQIVAEVPQNEIVKYATDLRSMTQARGYFNANFERYEEAPHNIAQKVIEEAKSGSEMLLEA